MDFFIRRFNKSLSVNFWSPVIESLSHQGTVVIVLATGFEVHGFKPVRGRWILSERKNPEYDFLRK